MNFKESGSLMTMSNKSFTMMVPRWIIQFLADHLVPRLTCRAYDTDSPTKLWLTFSETTANIAAARTSRLPRNSRRTESHLVVDEERREGSKC